MICEACGLPSSSISRETHYPFIKCKLCGLLSFVGTFSPNVDLGESFLEYVSFQNLCLEEMRANDTLKLLDEYTTAEKLTSNLIFDIGCGNGSFVRMAIKSGFKAEGCDISETAVELNTNQGTVVHLGTFESMNFKNCLKAVTMFCVLAHVEKPSVLLGAIHEGLETGGVLYFHTPVFCLIDSIGLGLSKVTRGKLNHILKRRLNNGHRRIYTKKSIEMLLATQNFRVISIEKKTGYGLKKNRYFEDMGIKPKYSKILGWLSDLSEKVGLLPKNDIYIYARK